MPSERRERSRSPVPAVREFEFQEEPSEPEEDRRHSDSSLTEVSQDDYEIEKGTQVQTDDIVEVDADQHSVYNAASFISATADAVLPLKADNTDDVLQRHAKAKAPEPPSSLNNAPAPPSSLFPLQAPAWCLGESHGPLPPNYGAWNDWNDEFAIDWENQIAEEFGMAEWSRGPNPKHPQAPDVWKELSFNFSKGRWQPNDRDSLPAEYANINDWWTAEGLEMEASLTFKYHIPWSLRGPPNGPEWPQQTWRGLSWRPGSRKWMNRGSKGAKGKGYENAL